MSDLDTIVKSSIAVTPPYADYIVISGRKLAFNELLNDEFFMPDKITELRDTFKYNKPFPHLVFDGMFSPALLELMYEDFNNLKPDDMQAYNTMDEKKYTSRPYARLGHASSIYFQTIQSGKFLTFLEQVTGIEGLIPDPVLRTSGLHAIPTGGKFAIHLDFNQDVVTKLANRLVFITYLNKDWLPAYGGALELWNIEDEKCEVAVQPDFGRSVLFAHSSRSLHGHPVPVDAPGHRPRRSAAAYYYTNGAPEGESTSFHTTIIYKRQKATLQEKITDFIKYLTPPIVVNGIQNLKKMLRKQ